MILVGRGRRDRARWAVASGYYTIALRQGGITTQSQGVSRRPMSRPRTAGVMTGPALLRAIALATADLAASAREVDALNVFPVPDGDTGTNMLATMRAAVAAAMAVAVPERSLGRIAAALAAGGLAGARGNSGVILSQILRGLAAGLDSATRADGVLLATALGRSAELATLAVARPVQGTMLTVIDEAARAALQASRGSPDVGGVLRAAVAAAGSAVRATPGQLLVLRDAGVVDSGALGLFVLLRGVLRGPLDGMADIAEWTAEPTLMPPPLDEEQGHEVMFVLMPRPGESLDVGSLREVLLRTADSVIVAGDASAVTVHLHVRDVEGTLRWGTELGTLEHIRVEPLEARVGPPPERHGRHATGGGVGALAIVAGDGLARVMGSLGVHAMGLAGVPGSDAVSTVRAKLEASGAEEVIVLVADATDMRTLELATGDLPGIHALGVRNAAEAVAAAAAFEARSSWRANAERMAVAAAQLRTLRVVDDPAGDDGWLVFDGEGRPVARGARGASVILDALATWRVDFELLTVYAGQHEDAGVSRTLREAFAIALPQVEVELIDGGQPGDAYLIAAE